MTTIRTTFVTPLPRAGLETLSRLQDREIASIVEAVTDGRLVGIVDQKASEIVGALTPEYANRFTSSDSDFASEVLAELKEATHELEILREIIRDALYEKDPIGWESRLMLSIDDVQAAIDGARDRAGEL